MSESCVKPLLWFVFRITVVHFITYFIIGLIALVFFDYTYWYSVPPLVYYMLPTSHPQVAMGPLLQIIRGIIFGLVLYPLRSILFQEKYGWLYIWGLLTGIGILSTFGPAPGSVEGMIYTLIPIWLQLAFLPEVLIQTLLLSVITYIWQRNPTDKRIWIPIIILFTIILTLAILGFSFVLLFP